MTSQPVRLSLVITELSVGGAERCLTRLAAGLDPARFTTSVYSLASRPGTARDALPAMLEQHRIPTHFLDANRKSQFVSAVRRLAQRFRDDRPDVVQSFLFHANVVAAAAARRARVPHVCLGIRVADPSWCRARLEARAARQVDRVVCVSSAVADQCRANLGVSDDRLVVVPNGLDPEEFSITNAPVDRAAFGIPSGVPLLLSAGRLARQKRFDWIVELLPRLLAALPDAHWAIAGSGPERARLERRVARTGLGPRVHFVGWQPDLRPWYAAADLLMLGSRYEGMPNVVMEAMACGMPVVSTSAHGVAELLGELGKVQTVELDDADGFVRCVVELVRDPERRREVGEANRRRVGEHFTLTRMIDRYDRLYSGLCRKP